MPRTRRFKNLTAYLVCLALIVLIGSVVLTSQFATPRDSGGQSSILGSQSNFTPMPTEHVEAAQARVHEAYGNLPLSFEANHGQVDEQVRFLSRGIGYNLFLTPTEAVLVLHRPAPHRTNRQPSSERTEAEAQATQMQQDVLRMRLAGANPDPEIAGTDELPGRSNYFIGNDPTRWRTNVAHHARVQYENVYPGVNLIYYGNQRQLEYDFVVAAGAKPNDIRMAFTGAQQVRIDEQGDLVLQTDNGEIRQHKPIIYQVVNGERKEITGRYAVRSNHEIGFDVDAYDASKPLVIDPVLVYSTYLGGAFGEQANDIAVDSAGNAYVAGWTGSINFPVANPFQPTLRGTADAFVTKLNASGTALVYSTYLGGTNNDNAFGIAVDSAGNAYVAGETTSTDFPVANPFQPTFRGVIDAFISKIANDTVPPAEPMRVVLSRDAGGQLVATITITNPLAAPVPGVIMTLVRASTLDGSAFVDGVPVPQAFGTINPGQSVTATVTFPGTAGVPGGFAGLVRVDLSYTGGTYSQTMPIVTPPTIPPPCIPSDPSPADIITRLIPDENDVRPIGNRTPVILIHGVHGNRWPDGTDWVLLPYRDYFGRLLSYFDDEDFENRYKIYRFHYESDRYSVREIARALRNHLDRQICTDRDFDKQFVIVAHSMGGLVARSYMNQYTHNVGSYTGSRGGDRTDKLITLATPHHGSIGACQQSRAELAPSDLWRNALDAMSLFYWQVEGETIFSSLRFDEPNRSDLLWDNFDGVANPSNPDINTWLAFLNIQERYESKITAYVGYIPLNDPVRQALIDGLGITETSPGLSYAFALRDARSSGDEHRLLLLTNIAQDYGTGHLYSLNDGLVSTGSARASGLLLIDRRVTCPGFDHLDMKDGSARTCTGGLTLFDSLSQELGIVPSLTSRTIVVNP